MSQSTILRCSAVAGLAGGLVLFALGSVAAAPVHSITAQVKSATTVAATDVRWRRWGRRHYAYGYWRSGSGCHVAGGYHRPDGCW
jgi:hypothetical protein